MPKRARLGYCKLPPAGGTVQGYIQFHENGYPQMALTDTAIRKTKPTDKPFKVADEKGLFLLVAPTGGKLWRMKYRFDGKEKRDEARKLLADGIDPGEHLKAVKATKTERAANSFEVVAREWYGKYSPNWAAHHGD